MSIAKNLSAFLGFKWLLPTLSILLFITFSWGALSVMKARLAATIYAERLTVLSAEYSALKDRYNAAVKRSAVTELEVKNGALSVRVRTAEGILRQVDVPYDPQHEIYVDYVIHDGRLWIRRVFDARTPPDQAVIIDPAWAMLDWKDDDLKYGKAVYRQLEEGVWTVTVTGNGSLGLVKTGSAPSADALMAPPRIRDFDTAVRKAERDAEAITFRDVFRFVLSGGKPPIRTDFK